MAMTPTATIWKAQRTTGANPIHKKPGSMQPSFDGDTPAIRHVLKAMLKPMSPNDVDERNHQIRE
jgi:hypothetical protein